MNPIALSIEHLNKTFYPNTLNEKKALVNLNLTLEHGDFITILGSNGAGKSTLFNAICGNFLPDSGKIILNGKNIVSLSEHIRARNIGRLFQDPMKGTAPTMTIEENLALAYGRKQRFSLFSKHDKAQLNTSEIRETIRRSSFFALNKRDTEYFRELLSTLDLGLENRMKTKVGILSGGQRQAVSLIMSTISNPELLLLDEHTAALDPETAIKIMKITETLVKKNNITTLMITHDINSALSYGNRTIMLDEGSIILDFKGDERKHLTPSELLSYYSKEKKKELANDRMLLSID